MQALITNNAIGLVKILLNFLIQKKRFLSADEQVFKDLDACVAWAKGKSKSEIVVYPKSGHAFHADYRPLYVAEDAQDGWKRCIEWRIFLPVFFSVKFHF